MDCLVIDSYGFFQTMLQKKEEHEKSATSDSSRTFFPSTQEHVSSSFGAI